MANRGRGWPPRLALHVLARISAVLAPQGVRSHHRTTAKLKSGVRSNVAKNELGLADPFEEEPPPPLSIRAMMALFDGVWLPDSPPEPKAPFSEFAATQENGPPVSESPTRLPVVPRSPNGSAAAVWCPPPPPPPPPPPELPSVMETTLLSAELPALL